VAETVVAETVVAEASTEVTVEQRDA
jgi:hypothetical protein